MKAYRKIKNKKIVSMENPQRSAEDQLASFSQQASIPLTIKDKQPDSWIINSFLSLQKNQLTDFNLTAKKNQFKQKQLNDTSKRNDKKCAILYKEQKQKQDLEIYLRRNKSREDRFIDMLTEKKSLSLTNYLLIDKRKTYPSNQTVNLQNLRHQKLVKFLNHRKEKKYPEAHGKCYSFFQKAEDLPLINSSSSKNMSNEKNQKKYQQDKKKKEKDIFLHKKLLFTSRNKKQQFQSLKRAQNIIQTSIHWSKAPIHQYLKKYFC